MPPKYDASLSLSPSTSLANMAEKFDRDGAALQKRQFQSISGALESGPITTLPNWCFKYMSSNPASLDALNNLAIFLRTEMCILHSPHPPLWRNTIRFRLMIHPQERTGLNYHITTHLLRQDMRQQHRSTLDGPKDRFGAELNVVYEWECRVLDLVAEQRAGGSRAEASGGDGREPEEVLVKLGGGIIKGVNMRQPCWEELLFEIEGVVNEVRGEIEVINAIAQRDAEISPMSESEELAVTQTLKSAESVI